MRRHSARLTRAAAVVMTGALITVAAPALVASPASAATQTITITKSGFVPMNQTIRVGDTISFTNSDVAVHQVLFKETTGFTCTVSPLVVQPTKTQTCTWTAAGTYSYSDPNQRDRNFRGTVKVDAAVPAVVPAISVAASTSLVTYGAQTTLSGQVTPGTTGTVVDIVQQAADEAGYTKVTSVATTTGGRYTVAVAPRIGTSYRAEWQNGTTRVASAVAVVSVRPAVRLALRSIRGTLARFTVKVTSSMAYAGKVVRVQRKNSLGGWTTVKSVTIGSFSAARFAVRVPRGTSRVRVFLPATQAGTGYVASASRAIILSR